MLTILVEPNKPSIWGPDGKWVAFTDSYNPDDSEYKAAYGDTQQEALFNLFDMFDETPDEIEIGMNGKWYDGLIVDFMRTCQ